MVQARQNRQILCSLVLFILIPAIAFSQTVAKITRAEGRVDVLRAGASASEPVKVGTGLSIGDIVRTKSDGRAEITFVDNTVMQLGPKSRLGIEEYLFKPNEVRAASLKLHRGRMGFKIPSAPSTAAENRFEIKTRTAVAGVRGTEGIIFNQHVERVYVKEKIIRFSNPLGAVTVMAGRMGEVVHNGKPSERAYNSREYERQGERMVPAAGSVTEATGTSSESALSPESAVFVPPQVNSAPIAPVITEPPAIPPPPPVQVTDVLNPADVLNPVTSNKTNVEINVTFP